MCRLSKLTLASASPTLAAVCHSQVPLLTAALTAPPATANGIPAAAHAAPHVTQQSGQLTIASFGPSVGVLSSKTRPKKLQAVASDGSRHNFLLKVR